jgi:hypothetical protein
VTLEIEPEPSEEERQAIVAALAAEDAEAPREPAWARAVLPSRDVPVDDTAA